ncbi:MAG: LysR family transcriptional regulator [Clostridiales bacterium]|nr:LysR family transcriptional regulator [Clostridiales bacterium]
MPINKHKVFLKVAAIKNISRVAEEMNYTQSAISHTIKALETELGVKLFVRSKTGVTLTAVAEELLPLFQNIVRDEQILTQTTSEYAGCERGTLNIGAFTSVSLHWMPRIIRKINDRYPAVKVIQSHMVYGGIEEGLNSGALDIGFLTSKLKTDLTFTPLYMDEYCVVVHKNHKFASWERVPLEALDGEALIIMDEQDGAKEAYDSLQIVQSIKNPVVAHIVNEDMLAIPLVEENIGISILPKLILDTVKTDAVIKRFAIPRYREIGIATNPRIPTTPLATMFEEMIGEYVKDWAVNYSGKSEFCALDRGE